MNDYERQLFNGKCPYTDLPCDKDIECFKCSVEEYERRLYEAENGGRMKKTVEISIDLYPDDIADYITEGNDSEQAEVIYLLAHKYYNDPHGFVAEVKYIRDYIKDCYNHDVQHNIKRMIKDMYEAFEEDTP